MNLAGGESIAKTIARDFQAERRTGKLRKIYLASDDMSAIMWPNCLALLMMQWGPRGEWFTRGSQGKLEAELGTGPRLAFQVGSPSSSEVR